MSPRTLAILLLAVAGLGACSVPEPPLAFDSRDLVVDGEWAVGDRGPSSPTAARRPVEVLCHDESFLALSLDPGSWITTSLTPGDGAVLDLAGCSSPPEQAARAGSPEPPARLEVEVESTGREPLHLEIPLSEAGDPWRETVDLGPLAGVPATLRLRAEGLRDTVWLRTARVSSFSPRELQKPPKTATGSARRFQVLFISVDTLREDALGGLGGEVATPAFDRFRAESQVFSPHYASAGWTRPSHGTLLTGLSPRACGAIGTKGVIRPGLRTLAERFQAAGFRTGALFYDLEWLHPRYGFGRGFETYRMKRWRLDRAVPEVVRWISDHREESFGDLRGSAHRPYR